MKKMIIKALFATLAITATTTTFGFINKAAQVKAEMKISYPDGTGGVWNAQVLAYLNLHDHLNSTIYDIDATGNRYSTCPALPSYYTITHVAHARITGHEDVPMNN